MQGVKSHLKDKVFEERKKQEIKEREKRNKLNYFIINELQMGNYFGEIGAISSLRRTSSVVAINSMLIGKIKISTFRNFMDKNTNFVKKIRKKVASYRD